MGPAADACSHWHLSQLANGATLQQRLQQVYIGVRVCRENKALGTCALSGMCANVMVLHSFKFCAGWESRGVGPFSLCHPSGHSENQKSSYTSCSSTRLLIEWFLPIRPHPLEDLPARNGNGPSYDISWLEDEV